VKAGPQGNCARADGHAHFVFLSLYGSIVVEDFSQTLHLNKTPREVCGGHGENKGLPSGLLHIPQFLIGWQLSIWICCNPSFSLLYNCQLLCIWRLALSIVVEVFPSAVFLILLIQGCLPSGRKMILSKSEIFTFQFSYAHCLKVIVCGIYVLFSLFDIP
jgi:hypothetical protein